MRNSWMYPKRSWEDMILPIATYSLVVIMLAPAVISIFV